MGFFGAATENMFLFVSKPNADKITGQIVFSNCVLSATESYMV